MKQELVRTKSKISSLKREMSSIQQLHLAQQQVHAQLSAPTMISSRQELEQKHHQHHHVPSQTHLHPSIFTYTKENLDQINSHHHHQKNRSISSNDESLSPPIYIGFGSITGHDSDRILQVILEALEKTGYRALLCGLAKDDDKLPKNVLKIGSISHDWLFQYGEFFVRILNTIFLLFSIRCLSSWWCRYNCCWSSSG